MYDPHQLAINAAKYNTDMQIVQQNRDVAQMAGSSLWLNGESENHNPKMSAGSGFVP